MLTLTLQRTQADERSADPGASWSMAGARRRGGRYRATADRAAGDAAGSTGLRRRLWRCPARPTQREERSPTTCTGNAAAWSITTVRSTSGSTDFGFAHVLVPPPRADGIDGHPVGGERPLAGRVTSADLNPPAALPHKGSPRSGPLYFRPGRGHPRPARAKRAHPVGSGVPAASRSTPAGRDRKNKEQ